MSGLLDSSVIVRYLIGDEPTLADRAAHLIESEADLFLSDVVIIEVAYTLQSVYRIPRAIIMERLLDLIRRDNFSVVGLTKETVVQALEFCRLSSRVSFGDAMIWAVARTTTRVVHTFDGRFPRDGIAVRQPMA